jgi:hypothetical protein
VRGAVTPLIAAYHDLNSFCELPDMNSQIEEILSVASDPTLIFDEFLPSLKILYSLKSRKPESRNARESAIGKAAQTPSSW